MDACIFILTINGLISVYSSDRATEIGNLSVGDKVCVMEIENGDWMKVHWSNGNVGHTGFIHEIGVKKPGVPSEPTPYEESESPPPPAPSAPEVPITPQNHSRYDRGPTPSDTVTLPTEFIMQCRPTNSTPYIVGYGNGRAAISGGKTGHVTPYDVEEVKNNPGNHVMYVKIDRPDQNRTLYLAFDYSRRGSDVSAIRVMAPGGYDAKDKCFMDWNNTN